MEKGAVIPFPAKQIGKALHVVVETGCKYKRLRNGRNAYQNGGHDVNRLAAIGKAVFEGKALLAKAVNERCIAGILKSGITVEKSDEFLAKAFEDNDYHILSYHISFGGRKMNDREQFVRFLL
jgi:hypothetical protein